jgi:hypothetical protein
VFVFVSAFAIVLGTSDTYVIFNTCIFHREQGGVMGDLSSVAYREAGNAVVAASYKIPIAEIWINEDGSGGSAPSRSYTHLEPVDQFAVLFGGYAAQKHFDTWVEDPTGGPSYLKIINTLLSMTEAERLSLVDMGRDRATNIIVANRLEVQRLVIRR